ncbi:peptide ABC transporter permease [Nocardia asteroides NBRC 15531]|uniref:Transport permease protein n=1 Tax=Nocardia asteroides NBRC 15531 TaxID=1110697 RepID=U5E363_NOCAS|nr:ABC transporter permease [Nocardia asteroides]TLF64624.1 peptide ABC transporter permease [Nocardia asteroides NBRC 15531]UGT50257.1 ABC transporter permease [Nocardia asteroides]SFN13964.1 ABC-2 type transport system permease protein [Nocardia asteroides]VEG36963.1 Daunorubicin/doxorubicin resistance ABC transporter permease protein drrB [Nocardia asteroides]GAD81982.1 putative ABC transporter permease protein [Nocardia asteroides NBRC 15531]
MTTSTRTPLPRVTRHTETLWLLLPQAMIQTERLLRRWYRDPLTVMQALVFPGLLLVMLNSVLGKQVSAFAEADALYGSVPMVSLVSVMSGSLAGVVTLGREREEGLLARFWVLPVHRASGLLSRVLAECARITVCTLAIFAVGAVLGFRFTQGPLAALALFAVPLIYGLGFATMVTALAVYTAKTTLVEVISLGSSLLMFFSSGFVPVSAYPDWARPLVAHNPLTHAVDTMRGLALGGPVRGPLLATLAWSLGALVVFAVPAVVGYRRASRY